MDRSGQQPKISLLIATVHEEQEYRDSRAAQDDFVVRTPPGALAAGLRIVLSADLDDGRRIIADNCFGMSGVMTQDGVRTEIDRMLGRDPDAHRPRVLAWGPLIVALESAGVSRSESELIATALEIRYEPAAQQVLEG